MTEKNILDVGAGDGLITYLLQATGIEAEETAVNIGKTIGVNIQLGDAYLLPYPDDYFEAVTMIDVLEHFDTPEKALAEARRVAPVIYIVTPERQPDRRVRDKFHVQEWTREELVCFMKENNYQLTNDVHYAKHGDTLYARFVRIDSGA